MCVLSVVSDNRNKVKLDLFILQELGRAFKKNPFIEVASMHKDNSMGKKSSVASMSLRATLESRNNTLGKGIFKNESLGLITQV